MNYLRLMWKLYKSKNNTRKTQKQINKLQNKKLRKILLYSYDHSNYYKETFEKAGIKREQIKELEMSKFPIINKNTFIKNFDKIVTNKELTQEELQKFDQKEETSKKLFKNKYHIVHSSGSTGKPRYFVYDEKAWEDMLIAIIRAALWNMSMLEIIKFLIKIPKILYIAATDGRYGGAMEVGDGIDGVGAKQLFLDIKTPLAEWIEQIKEFKPNMVIGYPSAIKILAELVERGELETNIVRVISCGEPLDANLRKYIEHTLNTEVINFYGASESLALGVEVNSEDGMYLFDDMNYIEVENGNMYITCLYNFAQPLIRYNITDRLNFKNDIDNKYPFSKAESLLGRNEDLMWFEHEEHKRDFLHPLAVEGFCIEGLIDYQFKKTSNTSFEMIAQATNEDVKQNIQKEIISQMGKILKDKKLEYVDFKIKFVNEILPDKKTGKKKLIA